jgi:cystathionine beta-lyase
MKEDTRIVHGGRATAKAHRVVNPPVYHASTVLSPTIAARREAFEARVRRVPGFYYGRSGNPTTRVLEEAVAGLEGGHDCLAFPSGLAAIAAAMLSYLSAGDHVLVTDGVYRPVRNLCDRLLARLGIETTYYPPLIGAGIAGLMRPETRVVYAESPASVTFEVQDLPAIAAAAHAKGARVLFDNTWATPLFFKPLAKGADVSILAATKYIGGHSDLMLGLVTTSGDAWPELYDGFHLLGQAVGPDDAYLAQRGLRTMGVRLRAHHANALRVAEWLQGRDEVAAVLYPALPGHPGYELWQRDFAGASGLFSVLLRPCSEAALAAMVDNLALYSIGASWGGYESLVLPEDVRAARSVTDWPHDGPVLRLHIGLEDPDDLIADLDAGFGRLRETEG